MIYLPLEARFYSDNQLRMKDEFDDVISTVVSERERIRRDQDRQAWIERTVSMTFAIYIYIYF